MIAALTGVRSLTDSSSIAFHYTPPSLQSLAAACIAQHVYFGNKPLLQGRVRPSLLPVVANSNGNTLHLADLNSELQEHILAHLAPWQLMAYNNCVKREQADIRWDVWNHTLKKCCKIEQLTLAENECPLAALASHWLAEILNDPILQQDARQLTHLLQGDSLRSAYVYDIVSIAEDIAKGVKDMLYSSDHAYIFRAISSGGVFLATALILAFLPLVSVAKTPLLAGKLLALLIGSSAVAGLVAIGTIYVPLMLLLCLPAVAVDSAQKGIHNRKNNQSGFFYFLLVEARTRAAWKRSRHTVDVANFFHTAELITPRTRPPSEFGYCIFEHHAASLPTRIVSHAF